MRARVIIIGGGFAGAATAIHLLRKADQPLEIVIIEPRATLGAGLAYSTDDPAHRINVPSDKMVVLADQPMAFTQWMERVGRRANDPAGEDETGYHYSRRFDFGAFMADLLAQSLADGPAGSTLTHLCARADQVTLGSTGATVTLGSGKVYAADKVVLAMSHARPAPPVSLGQGVAEHPGFYANPWDNERLAAIAPDAMVLVLGTGLTMVDVVSGLLARGHRGPIRAVSRRGLLPRGHAAFGPVDLLPATQNPTSVRAALRLARLLVAEHHRAGRDWQLAIESLRASASDIWQGWGVPDQRRALRQLRAFWDVHRFRIAPQLAARIAAAQASGQLDIRRAACVGISATGKSLTVALQRRGQLETVMPDALVLCTGPNADITRRDCSLLQTLFTTGDGRPDPHRLGLDVDAALRLRTRAGQGQPALHAVGPLTRGVEWEVVGVPELSAQADRLAGILLADLALSHANDPSTSDSNKPHEDMRTV